MYHIKEDGKFLSCRQQLVISWYNNLGTGQESETKGIKTKSKPCTTNSLLYYSSPFSCSRFTLLITSADQEKSMFWETNWPDQGKRDDVHPRVMQELQVGTRFLVFCFSGVNSWEKLRGLWVVRSLFLTPVILPDTIKNKKSSSCSFWAKTALNIIWLLVGVLITGLSTVSNPSFPLRHFFVRVQEQLFLLLAFQVTT